MKYQKTQKVWVRKKENKFEYFDIVEWKYLNFEGSMDGQNFALETDFAEK